MLELFDQHSSRFSAATSGSPTCEIAIGIRTLVGAAHALGIATLHVITTETIQDCSGFLATISGIDGHDNIARPHFRFVKLRFFLGDSGTNQSTRQSCGCCARGGTGKENSEGPSSDSRSNSG